MKRKAKPEQRRRGMTPAQAWALATRVYLDHAAPQEQRERDWLLRASRAHRAGNWVHMARMVDVCDLLQIPPPPGLAAALVPVFQAAATRQGSGAPRGGRHANVVRRAADAVQAVESLMQYEAARARLASVADKLPGRDALASAVDYFAVASVQYRHDGGDRWHSSPGKASRGYHLPRNRDALAKQLRKARKLLRDPEAREFIGANFPPRLLDRLAGK